MCKNLSVQVYLRDKAFCVVFESHTILNGILNSLKNYILFNVSNKNQFTKHDHLDNRELLSLECSREKHHTT